MQDVNKKARKFSVHNNANVYSSNKPTKGFRWFAKWCMNNTDHFLSFSELHHHPLAQHGHCTKYLFLHSTDKIIKIEPVPSSNRAKADNNDAHSSAHCTFKIWTQWWHLMTYHSDIIFVCVKRPNCAMNYHTGRVWYTHCVGVSLRGHGCDQRWKAARNRWVTSSKRGAQPPGTKTQYTSSPSGLSLPRTA